MDQIRCVRVSKQFSFGARTFFLNHWASRPRSLESKRFWALNEIDLTVAEPGKRLGIVGANGSGKTTLLRIIAGVTRPTRGRVMVHGRVVPLLELSGGMQQDLTGRENIYLNGILLGMRRHEVRQKFDSIVEFAGVSRFLDMPLKHYSWGMIARLGFSVAIHVEGEILLVDEAWGIGDNEFQAKSLEKIQQLQAKGVTTLIVSHNLEILRQLTDEVLWLEKGRKVAYATAPAVLDAYQLAPPERDFSPVYA